MKAIIFVNGDKPSSEEVKRECINASIIIAADGGANAAYGEGINPHYLIGDFDSIDKNILEYFKEKGSIIEEYSNEKDFLDTELCLNKAISLGAKEIVFLGGIGNRLDHNIGNIHLLYKATKKGVNAYILSETADVYICENKFEILGSIGDTISIVPLSQTIKGITLKGFKYPLNNSSFNFGDVFGTCNILLEKKGYIEIKEGFLAVIKQKNI